MINNSKTDYTHFSVRGGEGLSSQLVIVDDLVLDIADSVKFLGI